MTALLLLPLLACSRLNTPTLPESSPGADRLIVLVHGGGDGPEDWPTAMAEAIAANLIEPERWDVWTYDWVEDAEGSVNVTRRGEDHGRWLGARLAERDYRHLHLIGHSAGAAVLYGVTDTLVDAAGLTVHETYLDPFGGQGLVRWEYGERRYGEGADFADAVLNTLDGVPSTDEPFHNTLSFDVSALADEDMSALEGHRLPILMYEESVWSPVEGFGWAFAAGFTGEIPSFEGLGVARGEVIVVE
jgi:pimeloyl-ACP methyl ester carboxylesterase